MKIAFLSKLYPTQEQEASLLEHLEICRCLYNNALAERMDAWK